MDYVLQSMDYVLHSVDCTLVYIIKYNITTLTLQSMDCVLQSMDYVLQSMDYVLHSVDCTLVYIIKYNITGVLCINRDVHVCVYMWMDHRELTPVDSCSCQSQQLGM